MEQGALAGGVGTGVAIEVDMLWWRVGQRVGSLSGDLSADMASGVPYIFVVLFLLPDEIQCDVCKGSS